MKDLTLEEIKELLDWPNPPGNEEELELLVSMTNSIIREYGMEALTANPQQTKADWNIALKSGLLLN